MNLISNFVNKSFSAVFMLSVTSMVLAGLMIGTLTNHTILGFASVFVGLLVCYMSYDYLPTQHKSFITSIIVNCFKFQIFCCLSLASLIAADFTFDLSVTDSSLYGLLTFIAAISTIYFSLKTFSFARNVFHLAAHASDLKLKTVKKLSTKTRF